MKGNYCKSFSFDKRCSRGKLGVRDKQNCLIICQWLGERGKKYGSELVLMGCIINMEMVAAHAFFIGEISPLPLNLVNKSVSRETSMLAANRLTQIGNERISAVCRHFCVRCSIVGRLFVACPPSPDICLSVCFTLDYVQFSKTDCASVRFNVDNGNKTSP